MEFIKTLSLYEFAGLITGLLCVWLLIKQNIWTWPIGIVYVVISLIVFWEARLYADLLLHFLYLGMNAYGWYYWLYGRKKNQIVIPVTKATHKQLTILLSISIVGTAASGFLFDTYTDASLAYWDSATTVFSLTGMWLTARKKIENWYYWFFVDVLATGIYFYKGIYFYAILYLIYIFLAVSGYLLWRKSLIQAAVRPPK